METYSAKNLSDSSHIFHFSILVKISRPFLCCIFGDFDETPAGAPRETAQDEATLGTLTLCHLGAGEGGGGEEEGRNLHQETITGSHKSRKRRRRRKGTNYCPLPLSPLLPFPPPISLRGGKEEKEED